MRGSTAPPPLRGRSLISQLPTLSKAAGRARSLASAGPVPSLATRPSSQSSPCPCCSSRSRCGALQAQRRSAGGHSQSACCRPAASAASASASAARLVQFLLRSDLCSLSTFLWCWPDAGHLVAQGRPVCVRAEPGVCGRPAAGVRDGRAVPAGRRRAGGPCCCRCCCLSCHRCCRRRRRLNKLACQQAHQPVPPALQGPTQSDLLEPHPRVRTWRERVREAVGPESYDGGWCGVAAGQFVRGQKCRSRRLRSSSRATNHGSRCALALQLLCGSQCRAAQMLAGSSS